MKRTGFSAYGLLGACLIFVGCATSPGDTPVGDFAANECWRLSLLARKTSTLDMGTTGVAREQNELGSSALNPPGEAGWRCLRTSPMTSQISVGSARCRPSP